MTAPSDRPVLPVADREHTDVRGALGTLDGLLAAADGRLDGEDAALAAWIAATARRTLPRLDSLGPAAGTARTELDETVCAASTALTRYLRLPVDFADRRPIGDGLTGRRALTGQLTVIADHLDTIEEAVNQADAHALLSHGEHLATRFGTGYEPDEAALPVPDGAVPGPVRHAARRRCPVTLVAAGTFAVVSVLVLGTLAACDDDTPHTRDRVTAVDLIGDPADTASPSPTGPSPTAAYREDTAVQSAAPTGPTCPPFGPDTRYPDYRKRWVQAGHAAACLPPQPWDGSVEPRPPGLLDRLDRLAGTLPDALSEHRDGTR